MIKIYVFIILSTFNIYLLNAQDKFSGKYYLATVMKEKATPCFDIQYCLLKFLKDSVEVSFPIKTYCINNEQNKDITFNEQISKIYKWNLVNNELQIPEFKDFSSYNFEEKNADFIDYMFSQSLDKNKDTLVYCKYLNGKPSLAAMDIERKVAKKWGFVIEYITGDCTQRYDDREKECEIKNSQLNKLMSQKFGEKWVTKFEKEVEDEIKLFSDTKNLRDTLILIGIVKGDEYELLAFAKIELKVNGFQTYSDFDGIFKFKLDDYKNFKFPDTLSINYTGYKNYTAIINSIEDMNVIFGISNNTTQSYPTFNLEPPGDGYIEIVPYRKRKKLRKKNN